MSLTEKNPYWVKVIEKIEREAHLKTLRTHIKVCDLSVALPPDIRDRVSKILEYEFDEYDRNVFVEETSIGSLETQENEATKKKVDDEEFNESTCSEIERMEQEYLVYDAVIDRKLKREYEVPKERNWFTDYICKKRKDRVIWDTKIYDLETNMEDKTLDEQAEQLMDAAAERFTEWFNSLGAPGGDDIMTKEHLKSLFTIEGDPKLLSSILIDPKEVKAIARAVADNWGLPEMAIELKYENLINERLEKAPKDVVKVAFGRTVPVKDQPWIPSERDKPITTNCPEDLLNFEKLFKGITHLRSTRSLINFYKKRPQLERPGYLVTNGNFDDTEAETTTSEMPLYERLRLEY